MINATKKWIFLKISGAILIPLMFWFILNLIKLSTAFKGEKINKIKNIYLINIIIV